MSFIELLLLSVALAVDAFIVSFSYGLVMFDKRIFNAVKFGFAFGLFQFLMPLLGFNFTGMVYTWLKLYSKFIVFAIFMFLGIKFLKEAFEKKEEKTVSYISFKCLLWLSIATSIDAFGAGVSLKFLVDSPFLPSATIGVVTFMLSVFGFLIAGCLKKFPDKYIQTAGALLLIYLAIKSFL